MPRRLLPAALCLALSACSGGSAPGDGAVFPLYAGATLDAEATEAANAMAASAGQSNKVSRIYLTADAFEPVAKFYLAKGADAHLPPIPDAARILPNGMEIQRVVVILDGAKDLAHSNLWVNVQRPFVGAPHDDGGQAVFDDVRDLTTIAVVERR